MENETFRTKVANLLARTRKALRLYSNAISSSGNSSSGNSGIAGHSFSETQTTQWRDITSDLLKDLTDAVQKNQSVKSLSAGIFTIRDKFNSTWRALEAEIHGKHKEILTVLESCDYVKSAILSSSLVTLKARFQAAQAAHHELEELIKSSHHTTEPIKLTDPMEIQESESDIEEQSVANLRRSKFGLGSKPAKVIPIRKVL